jgi:hypothetical protein
MASSIYHFDKEHEPLLVILRDGQTRVLKDGSWFWGEPGLSQFQAAWQRMLLRKGLKAVVNSAAKALKPIPRAEVAADNLTASLRAGAAVYGREWVAGVIAAAFEEEVPNG